MNGLNLFNDSQIIHKQTKNPKYIIFKNEELLGYLNSEEDAKTAISKLADTLITEIEEIPRSDHIRIFRENITNGIRIYSQLLGVYINGSVILQHTLTWKEISEYTQS